MWERSASPGVTAGMGLGRRQWIWGTAAIAACASAEPPGAPGGEDAGLPLTRPSEVQPVLIADFGAPVSGSSSCWTLYDDGWATLSASDGVFFGEDDYEAIDRTLHLPAAEVDTVRDLLEDPAFAKADSHYHELHVMDGGATTYVGGAPLRRIVIGNRPELPGPLARLCKEVELLSEITQRRGTDPFVDPSLPARAKIRLRYDWWGGASHSGADRVTVYDDGLLEYRVTAAARVADRGDFPSPTAIMRRCDPAILVPLRRIVSGSALAVLPFLGRGADSERDSHHFATAGLHRLRYHPAELEPPLAAVVDVLEPLRAELRADYEARGLPSAG